MVASTIKNSNNRLRKEISVVAYNSRYSYNYIVIIYYYHYYYYFDYILLIPSLGSLEEFFLSFFFISFGIF